MILKPFVCGKTKIFFPSICSDSPYFTGTVDTTIRQGTDFDLRAGVNAYDGDGMTIPFTVTPSEVEVCQLGVQSFVYEAEGAKDTRYITVVAVDNPTITGLTPLTVKAGEEFDPNEGVVATDGNGNTVIPTFKSYPSIFGLTPITVQAGSPFDTLNGVTAQDGEGNPITVYCEEGNPYTPTEGTHTLHYYAVDSDGMRMDAERTVTASYGHFTGVNDTTVTQGTDFDLRSGVKAYDFNGNEIHFSVFPTSEFAPCYVGVQTYIYKASGIPDKERNITVTQIANPTISGLSQLTVDVDEEFDPLSGVTARDGNGNTIPSSDIDVEDGDTPTPTQRYTVTLHAGTGGTVNGGGEYNEGDTATVTAGLYQYYTFNAWRKGSESGEIVSTSSTYSFTVTEDVSLYATFTYHAPTTYCNINLSVETDGDASDTSGGTVSGGGQVIEGTSVTVTATPAQYYHFAHWRENGAIVSSDNPYTFTANSSRSLVARFLQDTSYSESIGITHNAGESMSSYTISGPVHSGVNITVHYTYQYDTGDGSASASFTQGTSGSKTDSHTGITISYAGGKTIKVSGGDTGSITLTSVRVML